MNLVEQLRAIQKKGLGKVPARPQETYPVTVNLHFYVNETRVTLHNLKAKPRSDDEFSSVDVEVLSSEVAETLSPLLKELLAARDTLYLKITVPETEEQELTAHDGIAGSCELHSDEDWQNNAAIDAWEDQYSNTHDEDGDPL